MFRSNTTFVIGAGASAEFDLPVGAQLAENIRKNAALRSERSLDYLENADLRYAIQRSWPELKPNDVFNAMRRIWEAIDTSVSIDAFIHRNSSDKNVILMGKALIAWNIAQAEAQSLMRPITWNGKREAMDRTLISNTWIGKFMRILFDGVSNPEDIVHQIKIICFNYDRCIEYYLRETISVAFQITKNQAWDIVSRMTIIHPYGSLGKIPLNDMDTTSDFLPFALNVDDRFPLRAVAERIITYTEQLRDRKLIAGIHSAIKDSKNLVFLGFGFNNQNMDLLRVRTQNISFSDKKNIYVSGYGFDEKINLTLKRRIANLFVNKSSELWNNSILIENGKTCSEIFNIHEINLSSFTQRYFSLDEYGGSDEISVEVLSDADGRSSNAFFVKR